MQSPALLKLMHLVSPALPVGAYAYSGGQEYAVDSGWLQTDEDITDWIRGLMQHSLARLDLPALERLYNAWEHDKTDKVNHWNNVVRANRETHELLLEDEQLGQALQRLLISLEVKSAETEFKNPPSFVTLFALAGVRWQIPLTELMQGLVWSWLENQIAAATKTVPLGQTRAQKLLVKLMEHIPAVCQHALTINDDEIGVGLPGLAIASARHERQYSRLFRS